jgi:hypothetical protein
MSSELPTTVGYTRLGNSGLKVSKVRLHSALLASLADVEGFRPPAGLPLQVILGTMTYGNSQWADWVLEEEESIPHFKAAWEAGINTWGELQDANLSELMVDQLPLHVLTPLCPTDTANVVGHSFGPQAVVAVAVADARLSLFSAGSEACTDASESSETC